MAIGFDVGGTLGVVVQDRGLQVQSKPKVLIADYGDGYTQRLANGIQNLQQQYKISITNRKKADIDDIASFLETKGGVTAFTFTVPDTNSGSSELAIKVICAEWQQEWSHDDYYNISATFQRVYEA